MDTPKKPLGKPDALAFLQALDPPEGDIPMEFTAEQLEDYAHGRADPETNQLIEAARALDPQIDDEIRVLQGELQLIPETQPTSPIIRNPWKTATFAFGAAACALAVLAAVNLASRPKEVAQLGGSSIIQMGGKTYAMAELSQSAVAALANGAITAGENWVKVSPPGVARGSDEFAISTPTDTTLEGSVFSLEFQAPDDVHKVSVSVRGPQSIDAAVDSGKFQAGLAPGLYTVRIQGEADNGQIVSSEFRIRIMDDAERADYERELTDASNPIDRLIVYANHGVRHEFDRTRAALGKSAPDIAFSPSGGAR